MNYAEIIETKVDSDIIEESFDLGKKMLSKYADIDTLMSLEADEFTDMKQLYDLATSFKEQAIKAIKQQNLQTEMIYNLTEIVKELREDVSFLQEEIDSLKSRVEKDD